MRFEKLEHFEHLVTIDMYSHFVALTESHDLNPQQWAARERHASMRRSGGGAAVLARSAFQSSGSTDNLEREGSHPAPPQRHGSAGSADDRGRGDGYMEDLLQQHRGVYARLGTFTRMRGANKLAACVQRQHALDPLDAEDGGVREHKPSKSQLRPMELQVLCLTPACVPKPGRPLTNSTVRTVMPQTHLSSRRFVDLPLVSSICVRTCVR